LALIFIIILLASTPHWPNSHSVRLFQFSQFDKVRTVEV
jgi:hypothetical protein